MANKEFQVRHGLVVNNTVLVANTITSNVGIGTSTPSYALDVRGSINAASILVNGSSADSGPGANSYANSVGTSVNAYATSIGASSNAWANTKLSASGGTVTGNVSITGWGNAEYIQANSYFDLTPQSTATYKEGRLYYSSEEKTWIGYGDYTDFEQTLGEREWVRCRNSTANTISKGKAVYVTGVHIPGHPYHGHHPTIELADAGDITKKDVIGITGHDIPAGEHGYVVVRGYIEGLNTAILTSGTRVHLGFNGDIVNDAPEYPNWPMDVGICLTSNTTNGTLYVTLTDHSMERLRVQSSARVGGDLTVEGDFTVLGSQSVVSTNSLQVGTQYIYMGYGDSVSNAAVTFTGSGLNDLQFKGHYENAGNTSFYVVISNTNPDLFSWGYDSSYTTFVQSNVTIQYQTNQPLSNGISAYFNANTGHTIGDKWNVTVFGISADFGLVGNHIDGPNGYTHAGIFRDATDGTFKMFNSYDPEPNGNIDIANTSFNLANLQIKKVTATEVYEGATRLGDVATSASNALLVAQSSNGYAAIVGTSANVYAASVGVGANAYATSVGTSANAYSTSVGTSGNAYALATATSIGTAGNSYATAVGTSGNTYAATVGVGANSYADTVGTSANVYAASVGVGANAYAALVGTSANTWAQSYADTVSTSANAYATSVGTSGNAYATSVGTSGNTYAASVGVGANAYAATVGTGANTYALAAFNQANNANITAVGAFAKANSALQNTTGVFAGDLTIVGNTVISGNAVISRNPATLPAPPDTTLLQISGADGELTRFVIDAFASNPTISFRRAAGTAASPSAIGSGQVIGAITSFGRGATGYSSASRASISSVATENWSDSAQGTYWTFSTTAAGTTTLSERMRIDASGNVGIGITAPTSNLHVIGTANITNSLLVLGSNITQAIISGNNFSNTKLSNTSGAFNGDLIVTGKIYTNTNVSAALVSALNDHIIAAGAANPQIRAVSVSSVNPGDTAGIALLRAGGGSYTSPTAPGAGVTLGTIYFQAFDGSTGRLPGALVQAQTAGTITVSSSPANLMFYTTASGSIVSSERVRILSTGNVGINTIAPTATLHVVGDGIVSGSLSVLGSNVTQSFISGNNFAGAMANSANAFSNTKLANTTGTFAGTLTATGDMSGQRFVSNQSTGDEGGEITLATAATNNNLSTSVTIDINQNKLRFFETGSPNRGAFINLSSAFAGVGSDLLGMGGTSFRRLNADDTRGAIAAATPINWFSTLANVEVDAAQTYYVEGMLILIDTATTHTQSLSIRSDALVDDFELDIMHTDISANNSSQNSAAGSTSTQRLLWAGVSNTALNTPLVLGAPSILGRHITWLRGTIRFGSGGNVAPRFQVSAVGPVVAGSGYASNTVSRGTFFYMRPIAGNTVTSLGNWSA